LSASAELLVNTNYKATEKEKRKTGDISSDQYKATEKEKRKTKLLRNLVRLPGFPEMLRQEATLA